MMTPQLNLIDMTEGDVEWFMEAVKTPHFNKGQQFKYSQKMDPILMGEVIKSIQKRKIIYMDGVRVGGVGIFETYEGIELSYFLLQEYEGMGIMTYVLHRLLLSLRGQKVYCNILKENARSLRVLERLGFEIVKEEKDTVKVVWRG